MIFVLLTLYVYVILFYRIDRFLFINLSTNRLSVIDLIGRYLHLEYFLNILVV